MINLAEIYNREIRLPRLKQELDELSSKKKSLLSTISFGIKQDNSYKANFFLESKEYGNLLDIISSINLLYSTIKEKQLKLTSLIY